MVPQSRWGGSPKPLGKVPKAVGEGSQSRWGGFPKPLGRLETNDTMPASQRHGIMNQTNKSNKRPKPML